MFAEANSDDRVVMALLNSGIGEVIVNVAATPSEHDFHLSLLHIIALIVKQRVSEAAPFLEIFCLFRKYYPYLVDSTEHLRCLQAVSRHWDERW